MSKKKKQKIKPETKMDIIETRVRRCVAMIIDWYITHMIVVIPITFYLRDGDYLKPYMFDLSHYSFSIGLFLGLFGIFVGVFYYIVIPTYLWKGQTIGKKIFGLKIVKNNEINIDLKTLLIRNGVGLILIEGTFYSCSIYFWELINIIFEASIASFALSILGIVSFISMFMSLLNSNHRMLHDYLSKTSVVTVHK